MRIAEIETTVEGAAPAQAPQAAPESRALVALTPPSAPGQAAVRYREAPFLAHLLAVKDGHAQTRERRRAAPAEAIAAYRATAALTR